MAHWLFVNGHLLFRGLTPCTVLREKAKSIGMTFCRNCNRVVGKRGIEEIPSDMILGETTI